MVQYLEELRDYSSITGGCHNHASLAGFIFNEVSLGMAITGINNWYADIYCKNSRGIIFSSSELANSAIYADGNYSAGGVWLISDCMLQSLTINQNYNGNISNLKLKNNWKIDGTDSSAYNN